MSRKVLCRPSLHWLRTVMAYIQNRCRAAYELFRAQGYTAPLLLIAEHYGEK